MQGGQRCSGEEGRGFRYILDGMNAERLLIAAECIGDAKWFTAQIRCLRQRPPRVRPPRSARTKAWQFPIARAYAQMRAAELLVRDGLERFEAGLACGEQANMAKMLAAEASWAAAEACVQTHGGFGFAEEYDVERKFRETRLYQVAPISTNLILSYVAEHVLGLPRSLLMKPKGLPPHPFFTGEGRGEGTAPPRLFLASPRAPAPSPQPCPAGGRGSSK